MKKIIRIISIVILVIVQFSCSNNENITQRKPKLIKYEKVNYGNTNASAGYSGITQKELIINLSFRNSGTITKLDMKLGQEVKKGQLLARLDNVSARLSYEQAITQRNAAKSNFNTAKLALERIRVLYEKSSVSLSDFEQAKNTFRTAKENYEAAKRTVAIQKDQINYGHIYAPIDGVIAVVNAEVNENISAGHPIAVLNAGEGMEIKVGVPENSINTIEKGDEVDVLLAALKNQHFTGEVIEVAPSLSQESATYTVRVALRDVTDKVKSGMAAEVRFKESDREQLLVPVVPPHAVGKDYTGNFVFLVIEQDSAFIVKKHSVIVGELLQSGFEIHSGIHEGDLIAVAGLQTLLDGQTVRLR